MPRTLQWRRERAARALCARSGCCPDRVIHGEPAWQTYLADADALLEIILSGQIWDDLSKPNA